MYSKLIDISCPGGPFDQSELARKLYAREPMSFNELLAVVMRSDNRNDIETAIARIVPSNKNEIGAAKDLFMKVLFENERPIFHAIHKNDVLKKLYELDHPLIIHVLHDLFKKKTVGHSAISLIDMHVFLAGFQLLFERADTDIERKQTILDLLFTHVIKAPEALLASRHTAADLIFEHCTDKSFWIRRFKEVLAEPERFGIGPAIHSVLKGHITTNKEYDLDEIRALGRAGTANAFAELETLVDDERYAMLKPEITMALARAELHDEFTKFAQQCPHTFVVLDTGTDLNGDLTNVVARKFKFGSLASETFEYSIDKNEPGDLVQFSSFIKDTVLIGHNISFDIEVLNAELEQNGIPLIDNKCFCTFTFAKQQLPLSEKNTLEGLTSFLGIHIDPDMKFHVTSNDVTYTQEVFYRLFIHRHDLLFTSFDSFLKVAGTDAEVLNSLDFGMGEEQKTAPVPDAKVLQAAGLRLVEKLNEETGSTELYFDHPMLKPFKIRYTGYEYQLEKLGEIIKKMEAGKNVTLVAPTGSGKTIFFVLLWCYLRTKHPELKGYLLTPTKILGAQHHEADGQTTSFQTHLREKFAREISFITGDVKPMERKENRLTIANAHVIEAEISNNIIRHTERPVILFLDEVHEARGDHAMAVVTRQFKKFFPHMKVFSATATPGKQTELGSIDSLIGNNSVVQVTSEEIPRKDQRVFHHIPVPPYIDKDLYHMLARARHDLFGELCALMTKADPMFFSYFYERWSKLFNKLRALNVQVHGPRGTYVPFFYAPLQFLDQDLTALDGMVSRLIDSFRSSKAKRPQHGLDQQLLLFQDVAPSTDASRWYHEKQYLFQLKSALGAVRKLAYLAKALQNYGGYEAHRFLERQREEYDEVREFHKIAPTLRFNKGVVELQHPIYKLYFTLYKANSAMVQRLLTSRRKLTMRLVQKKRNEAPHTEFADQTERFFRGQAVQELEAQLNARFYHPLVRGLTRYPREFLVLSRAQAFRMQGDPAKAEQEYRKLLPTTDIGLLKLIVCGLIQCACARSKYELVRQYQAMLLEQAIHDRDVMLFRWAAQVILPDVQGVQVKKHVAMIEDIIQDFCNSALCSKLFRDISTTSSLAEIKHMIMRTPLNEFMIKNPVPCDDAAQWAGGAPSGHDRVDGMSLIKRDIISFYRTHPRQKILSDAYFQLIQRRRPSNIQELEASITPTEVDPVSSGAYIVKVLSTLIQGDPIAYLEQTELLMGKDSNDMTTELDLDVKLRKILQIVEKHPEAKIMILTQTRDSVFKIEMALKEKGYRAAGLIGKGGLDGLTKEEQGQVVSELRLGAIDELAATKEIAGVGLDIPGLEVLIITSPIADAKNLMQAIGRLRDQGQVYYLFTPEERLALTIGLKNKTRLKSLDLKRRIV